MDIEAPESPIANVGLSLAALAAGAGLGSVAVHALLTRNQANAPDYGSDPNSIAGGVVGVMVASFAGLALDEFVPQWSKLGRMTALIGVGAVTVAGVLATSKQAFAAMTGPGSQPNQLPAAGSSGTAGPAQNLTAADADNGRTLNMVVGDTLTITLAPLSTGQEWQWGTTNTTALQQITRNPDVFKALAAGSAISLQGQLVSGGQPVGAPYTLTINIT